MILFVFFLLFKIISCFPEEGHYELNSDNKIIKDVNITFVKSMFKNSHIKIQALCESEGNITLQIITKAVILKCFNNTKEISPTKNYVSMKGKYFINCHKDTFQNNILVPVKYEPLENWDHLFYNNSKDYFTNKEDGIYAIIMKFFVSDEKDFNLLIKLDITSWYGYLSARDWPLMIFYSVMCAIYAIFALLWLVLSFLNWRDLLRIQFWIGAVIFLGMIEKALFVSEYQAINNTGICLKYPVLIAEIVSCIKRMLARILLMIVCIGYGIVKHRLGPVMKKILGVGFAYLVAALIEGYIRVLKPEWLHTKYTFVPDILLVVLDSVILWWSFSCLIQTIKQMRMKHNVVKFNLYRHFSNILIIVVIASIIFMVWALYTFKSNYCSENWKIVWINEAYWHVLFSIVLLTIVILWRPSKNSQRYAYSPLLDAEEDMDDDEEDNDIIMDNLTSGELRKPNKENQKKKPDNKTAEDDLKWIEENIPASAVEKIYPLADSDSEITPSKITAGKMD